MILAALSLLVLLLERLSVFSARISIVTLIAALQSLGQLLTKLETGRRALGKEVPGVDQFGRALRPLLVLSKGACFGHGPLAPLAQARDLAQAIA